MLWCSLLQLSLVKKDWTGLLTGDTTLMGKKEKSASVILGASPGEDGQSQKHHGINYQLWECKSVWDRLFLFHKCGLHFGPAYSSAPGCVCVCFFGLFVLVVCFLLFYSVALPKWNCNGGICQYSHICLFLFSESTDLLPMHSRWLSELHTNRSTLQCRIVCQREHCDV